MGNPGLTRFIGTEEGSVAKPATTGKFTGPLSKSQSTPSERRATRLTTALPDGSSTAVTDRGTGAPTGGQYVEVVFEIDRRSPAFPQFFHGIGTAPAVRARAKPVAASASTVTRHGCALRAPR